MLNLDSNPYFGAWTVFTQISSLDVCFENFLNLLFQSRTTKFKFSLALWEVKLLAETFYIFFLEIRFFLIDQFYPP